MSQQSETELAMFGELEDAPEDRMVVRAIGHVLGTAAGWFHYEGLSVIFPEFRTDHPKLTGLITDIQPDRVCLAIDFYTGEVKIIEGEQGMIPKVHSSLQLQELNPQPETTGWQPVSTAPPDGKFLIANYAPTNWAYTVQTVQTNSDMPPRHRVMQLRYARAWQPLPAEPPEEMRDVNYD